MKKITGLAGFFTSQSAIVVGETAVLAVLMFATFSILVRVAGMEVTGLWILLNSVLGFTRVADFWSRGLSSFVGEARGNNDIGSAAGFVSTAVISAAAGYLVVVLMAIPLLYLLSDQIAGPDKGKIVREILPIMGCAFWLLCVGGVYQLGFLGFGQPLLKAVQTVGGAVVFLAGAVVLAPLHGIRGILLAQVLQGAAMLLFAMAVFHLGPGRQRTGSLWQADRFRQLAVFGGKAIIVGGLQLAIEPVTKLLASQFGGLSAVTLIELASRMVNVVRSIIASLGQILIPGFAREAAQNRETGNRPSALYRDACRLAVLLAVPGFCIMLSAASLIELVVLDKTATGFVTFVWLLSAGGVASAISSPAYFLLIGVRRLRPLFWANLILTGVAIGVGTLAGLMGGVEAAMAGVAIGFILSSIYTVHSVGSLDRGDQRMWLHTLASAQVLVPVTIALGVSLAVTQVDLHHSSAVMRLLLGVAAIVLTALTCFIFGRIRSIPDLVSRIQS